MSSKMRWIVLADYSAAAQVLASAPAPHNWSEKQLRECLSQGKANGQYIAHGREIVGVVIYRREDDRAKILNFAVKPEFRRRGIGATMLEAIIRRLRERIVMHVPAESLDMQQFLRARGVRATDVLHRGEREFYLFEIPPKEHRP